MKTIRFSVPVACQIPYTNTVKTYDDCGVLILPDSYTDNGAPTRLVFNCHGAGGTITTDDSHIEGQALSMYLVANGYAVVDVNGLPAEYAAEFGIDLRNNIGSNFAIDSYCAAYQYCMDNYNFKKEVFVHGGSMGGISSTNLVLSQRLPVIAQTGFCPVLDTYNEIFLHPWSGGLPKTALAKIYSFDVDSDGQYIYDESKVRGCNPMKTQKKHPCPVFFCHCADDPIVNPEITKKFVEKIKADGVEVQLLLLPAGRHEPQRYGPCVEKPTGKDTLNGQQIAVTEAVEAAFLWIKKYD